jgi:hypothetical protein
MAKALYILEGLGSEVALAVVVPPSNLLVLQ